ncbi:hypothetical protein V6N11_051890 [Hibiscus sabdariffa]|uniref:Uncharacterized protein n=1 Tax=Hibiscus sabdariffa TaxID=183260 RepID=A0ABR2U8G4_9ROSI
MILIVGESREVAWVRYVESVLDEEKVPVLNLCEVGWVKAVENRGVVACVESDDKSHEGSVGSSAPICQGVVSVEHVGLTERVFCHYGGVLVWTLNTLDKLEDAQQCMTLDVLLDLDLSGEASACLAHVIGIVQGGDRKFKSMNALVESLSLLSHKRALDAAHFRNGHGRTTKVNYDVVIGATFYLAHLHHPLLKQTPAAALIFTAPPQATQRRYNSRLHRASITQTIQQPIPIEPHQPLLTSNTPAREHHRAILPSSPSKLLPQ